MGHREWIVENQDVDGADDLDCPHYRFFNFMFVCVLYRRLVDLLVKLSIEANPEYAPRVNTNQFVTIAK